MWTVQTVRPSYLALNDHRCLSSGTSWNTFHRWTEVCGGFHSVWLLNISFQNQINKKKKKKKKQELGFFHRILDPGCRFFSHFSHKGVAATTRKSLATDSPTLLALRCRRVVQSKHCVNMQLTIYMTLRQRNSFLLFVRMICRTRRSVSPPKKHGDNTLHRHFLYSRW